MRLTLDVPKKIFLILLFINFVDCRKFQIVGGYAANIQQFPFQIVYYSENDFVCSGSLISPLFILTAAHCTYYFSSQITVRLGSSFRDRDGIVLSIVKHYVHPQYNSKTNDYDFAILRLNSTIRYSRNIQPARLPDEDSTLSVGQECTVSGWGVQSFNDLSDPPIQIMMTTLQVYDFNQCKLDYEKVFQNITERMLCASVPDGTRDSCLGDSGGPLICNGTLWGVVSFGYGCAIKDYPGIYSYVPTVLGWIKKTAQIR
ncbi:trypsin 3A1-like [Chironomus tepperi]|uniref:trypsin 3A1-like n=1 Tax=Chironomus tepperi TaxID=113505 RepID=UPI00391F76CD